MSAFGVPVAIATNAGPGTAPQAPTPRRKRASPAPGANRCRASSACASAGRAPIRRASRRLRIRRRPRSARRPSPARAMDPTRRRRPGNPQHLRRVGHARDEQPYGEQRARQQRDGRLQSPLHRRRAHANACRARNTGQEAGRHEDARGGERTRGTPREPADAVSAGATRSPGATRIPRAGRPAAGHRRAHRCARRSHGPGARRGAERRSCPR